MVGSCVPQGFEAGILMQGYVLDGMVLGQAQRRGDALIPQRDNEGDTDWDFMWGGILYTWQS